MPENVSSIPDAPTPSARNVSVSSSRLPRMLTLFLLLIVLLLISGIAYYLGQLSKQKLVPPLPPEASPIVVQNDMSNWKTYTNQNMGFIIKYPDDENEITPYEVEAGVRVSFCRGETEACKVMVERLVSTTIEAAYNIDADTSNPAVVSSTRLSDYLAGSHSFQRASISDVDVAYENYYLQKENDTYVISFPNSYVLDSNIKDQILSTFQFVDKGRMEGNSYINSEYSFSFDLEPGERVRVCPNKNEFNDNISVSVVSSTIPEDSTECATDGPNAAIFASRKAGGKMESSSSIEDTLTQLKSPNYDYQITTSELTITGISGVRVIGSRDTSKAAPLPDEINEGIFFSHGVRYSVSDIYLQKNFRFLY